MKERNPMPIRKFTLIGLIALGLIILSIVGELFTFNIDLYTSIQTLFFVKRESVWIKNLSGL